MCRWFAFISLEPVLLEDVLINPPHAITKQVHDHYLPGLVPGPETDLRNVLFNIDGFGVTWYTDTRSIFDTDTKGPLPALYKTVAPALTDPTFTYICANTASKVISAHIRAATRPPVVPTNNHPFVFGRHNFMHNGSIAYFPKIRTTLLLKIKKEYSALIYGNTDTEHLAALYFTFLGDINKSYSVRHMRDSLIKAIHQIEEVQKQILTPEELKSAGNSLNLCSSDGEQLVACRYRNVDHPDEEPPSLYVSTKAGTTLNRQYGGSVHDAPNTPDEMLNAGPASSELVQKRHHGGHDLHVIVASEPTTFALDEWKLLGKNELIMVDKDMSVRVEDMGA
ncbi:hypothetical protein PLICRDRAFT_174954 [Plicaturopsis crispa FD-325 SS-3]|nr:hypothetical protein PLICRDRAFT_174954 [Plicaturopsis crispa FD-325 SS-3]